MRPRRSRAHPLPSITVDRFTSAAPAAVLGLHQMENFPPKARVDFPSRPGKSPVNSGGTKRKTKIFFCSLPIGFLNWLNYWSLITKRRSPQGAIRYDAMGPRLLDFITMITLGRWKSIELENVCCPFFWFRVFRVGELCSGRRISPLRWVIDF